MNWTKAEAVRFCTMLEGIAPRYGMHVALTGGLLYGHDGEHKDCDVILYRIRQGEMKLKEFFEVLEGGHLSSTDEGKNPWCHKFVTNAGRKIDFLVPEAPANADDFYISEQDDPVQQLSSI